MPFADPEAMLDKMTEDDLRAERGEGAEGEEGEGQPQSGGLGGSSRQVEVEEQ
jgi:hypothetical protein